MVSTSASGTLRNMATKTNLSSEVSLEIDGILSSDVKAKTTEEFLKYILYQRQQIPVTYDTLKGEVFREGLKSSLLLKEKRELKKKQEILDRMDQISNTLTEVFTYGLVKEVLVILGATVVTPKELYRLQFPCGFYEGNTLTLKQCTSILFRKLISNDFLADLKPPKSSKLSVLVLAPRDITVDSDILIPKLNYKIPQNRGNQLKINIKSTATVGCADLSRYDEAEFDISGIEPLEKLARLSLTPSVSNRLLLKQPVNTDIVTTPCTSKTEKKRHTSISCGNEADTEDFVWFQIAASVLGYKDKTVKKDSESLFMM